MASAASGSSTTAVCKELTILLPGNKEALCWFDSVNFALFHKQRPELDEYLKANPTGIFSEKVKELYGHYSGNAIIETNADNNIHTVQDAFRKNTELQTIFNKKVSSSYTLNPDTLKVKASEMKYSVNLSNSKKTIFPTDKEIELTKKHSVSNLDNQFRIVEKNSKRFFTKNSTEKVKINGKEEERDIEYFIEITPDLLKNFTADPETTIFDLNAGTYQEPDEYLLTYCDKIFTTAYVKSGTTETKSSPNIPYVPNLQDIRFGLEEYVLNKPTINDIYKLDKDCKTIFFSVNVKGSDTNINYLEKIKIPLYENISTDTEKIQTKKHSEAIFTLDAIIVRTSPTGGHYYTIVRCGNTDDWAVYNDTDILQLEDPKISTLEELHKLPNDPNKSILSKKVIQGFDAMRKEQFYYKFPINNTNTRILIYSRQ
jgi:hypothetical protein